MSWAAEFELALKYMRNNHHSHAIEELLRLAQQGHLKSQAYLGCVYENGWGVNVDLNKAKYFYEKASQGGDAGSHYNLGNMLAKGIAGPANPGRAHELYRLAAGAGIELAQVNYAVTLIRGIGTLKNIRLGLELLHQYGDEGNSEAQLELGTMYAEGSVLRNDWHEAARWWLNAAEHDNGEAQLEVGKSFSLPGRGLKVNLVRAFKYLFLAQGKRVPTALEHLRSLKLSDVQLENAKDSLSRWKPTESKGLAFVIPTMDLE